MERLQFKWAEWLSPLSKCWLIQKKEEIVWVYPLKVCRLQSKHLTYRLSNQNNELKDSKIR